jgi:hypothetical protein
VLQSVFPRAISPTKTMGIELEELLLERDDDDLTDDETELLLEL